jgi:LCP family protein required for cell wall assembly
MSKHAETKEKKQVVENKNRNKNQKKKKSHKGLKILLIILIVLGISTGIFAKKVYDLGGGWQGVLAALMGHNKNTLKNLDKMYILLMGESTGSSDTIIVCSYDPKTQEASMLSIPRDTFVGTSKSKAKASNKINSLYTAGQTPEKTIDAVNKITGLNISNYVLVDTKALVEMVNLIGGVNFDVPIDMKYDDYTQDLHIDLKAGMQKLTGEQVEQLVRFRHNNNGSTYSYDYGMEDYGRMKTQRALITEILKQTIKVKNIREINNVLDIVKKYVKTNMDLNKLKDYLPYATSLNMDNIKAEQLPGESKVLNGIWFFLYDEDKSKQIVNDLFLHEQSNTQTNEVSSK